MATTPTADHEDGQHLLHSGPPMNPDEDKQLLKLELEEKIGPDSFDRTGVSGVYYGDYVVDLEEINFYLYTCEEYKRAQLLPLSNPTFLERTHWNPDKITKFYIHGFMQSGVDMIKDLINAYFVNDKKDEEKPNLIIVDWGKYSHGLLDYFYMARFVVPLVGIAVGKMIQSLLNKEKGEKTTTPELIHIIGHSLGAQIASNASKYLKIPISRITALDPAQPAFEGIFGLPHITKHDANFVDVIHSNMQVFGYGMYSKVGHVDFYPNGGAWQNGCFLLDSLSNHERSVRYFIESINSTLGFYSQKCDSWKKYKDGTYCPHQPVLMGDQLNTKDVVEGKYYLRTNSSPPYARGKED